MSDTNTLDLHEHTWAEALEAFIEFYNSSVQRAGGNPVGSLDVVHGYGSTGEGGILRSRLRGFLQRHEDCLEFRLGESVDGSKGHTSVIPLKMLPDTHDLLVEQVWDFCAIPKSQSKITGRFRRHGDREVLKAVRYLELQHRLELIQKGVHALYKAV